MMPSRLGAFAYRFRWPIICAWLAIFLGALIFAPRVTSILRGGGYSIPTSQASTAFNAITKAYGYRALAFTAVFQGVDGTSHSAVLAEARVFRHRLGMRFAKRLTPAPPVTTSDRRVVFVRIYTKPRKDFGIPLTGRIRPLLPTGGRVRGYLTGPSAIFFDMEQVSDNDLRRMEIITFPIALVILLVIFGTVLGAVVPVSMGPLTVTLALASIFFLGHVLSMSIFVLNTASMLGLGVAIDYSLFMVQRFREELRRGHDVEEAITLTVSTAGVAITISAITVAIGFLGMTVFRVTMLTSLGIGGSIVVVISLACALTFLPAIMSVLGERVNDLALLPRSLSTEMLWHRLAAVVMRRPWQVIVGVVVVILLLALPARGLRVGVPGPDILPKSAPSRIGDTVLRKHIGIANQSPVLVVLRSRSRFQKASTRLGLLSLAGRICHRHVIRGVAATPVINSPGDIVPCRQALLRTSRGLRAGVGLRQVALISIFIHASPFSASAESFVTYLRGLPRPPGVAVSVGGQTAAQLDFDSFLYGQFPWAILFVVVAIFLILAISFRSLLLPVKAVLMNGLSVLAAYGATVLAFQQGFLRSLLGFTPTGSLDSIVPVFIFCVLFGLSTDYEVFLLARIREELRRTGDNAGSIATGLARTGRIITSAALIMVVIFGAFSFANLVVIKELGFAMAVGVLVDATLIRALLVPAAMKVLGEWNWWPSRYSPLAQERDVPGPTPPELVALEENR